MRIIQIPKGNGRYRTIYVPDEGKKLSCRKFLRRYDRLQWPEHVQGFVIGRNIVTNAKKHIGFRYTLSFDLANFFDNVTQQMVDRGIELLGQGSYSLYAYPLYTYDRNFPQGFPTSPFFCNIGALRLDKRIIRELDSILNNQYVYTRYADDIAVSFNDKTVKGRLISQIREICERYGLPINEQKIKFQGGRRIICGVGVDMTGIYPTRKAKRKLRAALHQRHSASASGLREHIELKEPSGIKKSTRLLKKIESILSPEERKRLFIKEYSRKTIAVGREPFLKNLYVCNSVRSFMYWYNTMYTVKGENGFDIML